jgi:hypothetical protein
LATGFGFGGNPLAFTSAHTSANPVFSPTSMTSAGHPHLLRFHFTAPARHELETNTLPDMECHEAGTTQLAHMHKNVVVTFIGKDEAEAAVREPAPYGA